MPGPTADELEALVRSLALDGQVVSVTRLPARSAQLADPTVPLPDAVAACLPSPLWSHQARAIDLVRAGTHLALATGTASGKSLVYQAAIGAAVHDDPGATALAVYPTKALAHDQLRALASLALPGVVPAAYDGDAGPPERTWVRQSANVVLTNPDMLHAGLLPNHGRWERVLAGLRYVVVDELHTLRGIFGSHVSHVLRRLRRLCAHHGADPTFVFTSATIGSPGALAEALCGSPVRELTADGSPQGERVVALWEPPLVDADLGIRRSAHGESAAVLAGLVAADHRTVAFTQSRRTTELVAAAVQRSLARDGEPQPVLAYRGGYLPEERREVEQALARGAVRGVVATSALELGIDVGGLDACVLDGFPGTIASFWQRAGRAGRRAGASVVVMVAGSDLLDQWLVAHPDELLGRPPEPAVVNPDNPFVLHPHLRCAAHELPLVPADRRWWGDGLDEAVADLVQSEDLTVIGGRAVWAGRGGPSRHVGLRTGSSTEFRIADAAGDLVGTVDEHRAYEVVHPGAIYLHRGTGYRVDELDLADHVAYVSPTDADETTRARSDTTFRILDVADHTEVGHLPLTLGAVEVTEQVVGYDRLSLTANEVIERVALDLPPTRLVTRAFWWVVEPQLLAGAGVDAGGIGGTLHAVEHAAIGVLPLFTICDRWDVGGVSTPRQADTGRPTIVIYDGYPGGAGVAELGFSAGRRLLERTREVIEGCPCATGCPSCIQSPKCGNGNEPLDKAGARSLLATAL